jgi:hypothetical protein
MLNISATRRSHTLPLLTKSRLLVSSNAKEVDVVLAQPRATVVLVDTFLVVLVKGWLLESNCGWRKYVVL